MRAAPSVSGCTTLTTVDITTGTGKRKLNFGFTLTGGTSPTGSSVGSTRTSNVSTGSGAMSMSDRTRIATEMTEWPPGGPAITNSASYGGAGPATGRS